MKFVWIEGKQEGFKDAYKIREAVFVKEQGYSLTGEFDETDSTSLHVVGFMQQEAVCTARIYPVQKGVYAVGRVAVLQKMRGNGTGRYMLEEIIKKARRLGVEKLVLNAQADKDNFYKRAGFVLTGQRMLDEGQPHVGMELFL